MGTNCAPLLADLLITELSPFLQELSFLLASNYIKSFCSVEAVKFFTKHFWTDIGKT
jgi:hypothetical protein